MSFGLFNQDVSNGLSGVNGINGLFAASASLTIADEISSVRGTAKALQGIKALKNIGTGTAIFGLGLTTGIALL
ncbi:MAG: hypothetical protein U5Q03_18195 [Bacteroidota bacterium]|nr:hypothetical protein [Bacteroidota bacterium]